MLIGIVTILYLVFAIWTIWFSKKKSKLLISKILYSFLALILVLLLSSFSFSPKTSFFIKSFPMNLDREFKETIVIEDYTLVVYQEESDFYGFEVFYKFLNIAYVEDSLLIRSETYKNIDDGTLLYFTYVNVGDTDYLLLFNEDLKTYSSLIIGDQEVDLMELDDKIYSVFILQEPIENIETVILNNQTYIELEIE
jgi:hypothetical protein